MHKSLAGMSALNLMIGFAIVTVMIYLAIPKIENILFKAKQTEAVRNMMYVKNLLISKESQKDFYAGCDTIDPKFGCILNTKAETINSDISEKKTNCSLPNNIGFNIDCNAKYQYSYIQKSGQQANYVIVARSFDDISGCGKKFRDVFMLSSCGKICNIMTIDLKTCKEKRSSCKIWSCE